MKKILITLLLAFMLICPAFAYTDSSIFIPNISKKQAIDAIVENGMSEHWNILNVNDYSITLRQDMTGLQGALFGSSFNPTPERRLQYNILQKDNGVIISIDGQIVSNPRSGYENSIRFADASIIQEIDKLSKMFLGYYTYGIEYGKLFNMAVITEVKFNSEAYKSGIRNGYIITTINGQPIKKYNSSEVLVTAKPSYLNQELNITYKEKNKAQPQNLILKSEFVKPIVNSKSNI